MENSGKKFMATYDTETEVLRKIEELKAQGYTEDDMYVMAHNEDQISMVRGRTDVDYKSSEGGWMDKFMSFLSGEDATREAFNNMGVDQAEADRYYNEIQNGKILLYVDREYGASYSGQAPYDNTAYADNAAVASPGLTVDTNDQNSTVYNTDREYSDTDDRLNPSNTNSGYDNVRGTEDQLSGTNLGGDLGRDRMDDTRPLTGSESSSLSGNDVLGGGNDTLGGNDTIGGTGETEEEHLRLHEERLNVDTERVQTGEVNVGKHVVEEEKTIEVPVEREEVYVERRPVNEATDAGGLDSDGLNGRDAYREGEDIHIPLSEERVNVTKSDVVSEEIVVGKRKVQDTETVRDTVRREEADIDEDVNPTDGLDTRNDKDRF